MIALLLLLFALFGFSSGSTGTVTRVPATPAQPRAARVPLDQRTLTPAKGPCVKVRPYRAGTSQGPVATPCNSYSGAKP